MDYLKSVGLLSKGLVFVVVFVYSNTLGHIYSFTPQPFQSLPFIKTSCRNLAVTAKIRQISFLKFSLQNPIFPVFTMQNGQHYSIFGQPI